MADKNYKDYIYHPPLLDTYKIGFRFGVRYPMNPAFGNLQGQRHLGLDYIIAPKYPVYAIAGGRTKSSTGAQGGNTVTLTTNNGLSVRYMHLSRFVPASNSLVNKGEIIGYTGNTGVSTISHLHMDVYNGLTTNPNNFYKFIDPEKLNYQIKEEEPMADIKYTGEDYITRICENYEILQVYPDLFLSHKYKFKDGEFAWNSTGGFRDFVKWWATNKSKEDFKKAVEADYQTWLKGQK
jgi:hypothetical protein